MAQDSVDLDARLEAMLEGMIPFQRKTYRGRQVFFLPSLNMDELILAFRRNGLFVVKVGRNGITAVGEWDEQDEQDLSVPVADRPLSESERAVEKARRGDHLTERETNLLVCLKSALEAKRRWPS